jgi:predicted nucleic acid-binding protein
MTLVCIDNHILIWGIRKTATPGQGEMIERTAQLLENLDEQKTKVIVPAPVVAEFLVGAEERDHTNILQTLQQRFIVVPFDALAALATARARRKNRQSGLEQAVRQELANVARPQVAIDHMILGIALANRADLLYTEDEALRKFAEPHITVRNIPPAQVKQWTWLKE